MVFFTVEDSILPNALNNKEGLEKTVQQQLEDRLKELQKSNEKEIVRRSSKFSFFKATKVEMTALIETLHSYIADSVDVLFNEQLVEFMEKIKWAPADGKTIFFDYRLVDFDGSDDRWKNIQRKNTIIFDHFHVAVQKFPPKVVEGGDEASPASNKLPPELVSYSIATDDFRYMERREEISHEEQLFSAQFTELIEVSVWPEVKIIFTLRAVVSLLAAFITVMLISALTKACFGSQKSLEESKTNVSASADEGSTEKEDCKTNNEKILEANKDSLSQTSTSISAHNQQQQEKKKRKKGKQ